MRFRNIFLYLFVSIVFGSINAAQAAFSESSVVPANSSTDVARNVIFEITFPVTSCRVPAGPQAQLKRTSDDYVMSTGLLTQSDGPATVFTMPINVTLASSTAYYLSIPSFYFWDCVSYGNGGSTPIRVDFTTGTCTGPGTGGTCQLICFFPVNANVEFLSPPDSAHFMQAYQGLNIVFDRNVSVGTGNITIKKYSDDSDFEVIDVTSNRVTGWGTSSITIDPVNNLLDNTHYYVNFDYDNFRTSLEKDNWDFYTKSTPNTFSGSGL